MKTENNKIDWEQVRINAAISIIQTLITGKHSALLDIETQVVAKRAVIIADELIDELRKPRHSKSGVDKAVEMVEYDLF